MNHLRSIRSITSILLSIALLLCAFALPSGAADATVSNVSCTVNGDPSSCRGFCWYTPDNTDSAVIIRDSLGQDVTASLTASFDCSGFDGMYCHKATVCGLAAGETYTYVVGNGETWSDEGAFTTDDGDDSVDFISVGDVQATPLENFRRAAAVVDKALEMMPDPDFFSMLGDFTNDCTEEEWGNYFTAFKDINARTTLVPVAGNHDEKKINSFFNHFSLNASASVSNINGVNYSYDVGNAHIAVVNTNDILSISLTQMDWLRNDMNSTDKDWKIVFMHKSPYTLGKDGKWPDAQYLKYSLCDVIDETGVDLVMSGHDHMYLRTKPVTARKEAQDGAVYVLGGTAGTKRYELRTVLIDTFMPKDLIAANVVQKDGYGNYFDGETWDNTDQANIGGCFETVSIRGGELTLNAYIVSDADGSVKNIDSFTLSKQTGQNKATYGGDNTVSAVRYIAQLPFSLIRFAGYAFFMWLPKFITMVPEIIRVYRETDTF